MQVFKQYHYHSLIFEDTLMLTHTRFLKLSLFSCTCSFLHFFIFLFYITSSQADLPVFVHTCTLKFLHTVIFFMLSLSHGQFSCTESVSYLLCLSVSQSLILSPLQYFPLLFFLFPKLCLFHIQWFSNPSGAFENGGGWVILGFSLPRYISLLTSPLNQFGPVRPSSDKQRMEDVVKSVPKAIPALIRKNVSERLYQQELGTYCHYRASLCSHYVHKLIPANSTTQTLLKTQPCSQIGSEIIV